MLNGGIGWNLTTSYTNQHRATFQKSEYLDYTAVKVWTSSLSLYFEVS
jgi:hypothetical protein